MANVPRLGRETDRRRFVLGFAFSAFGKFSRVILIQKDHSKCGADQVGKWNGLGGEVEPGETYHHAMVREFREEAGVTVRDWNLFCIFENYNSRLFIFRAALVRADWRKVQTLGSSRTDEIVASCAIKKAVTQLDVVPDLRWLLPLAQDGRSRAVVRVDWRGL